MNLLAILTSILGGLGIGSIVAQLLQNKNLKNQTLLQFKLTVYGKILGKLREALYEKNDAEAAKALGGIEIFISDAILLSNTELSEKLQNLGSNIFQFRRSSDNITDSSKMYRVLLDKADEHINLVVNLRITITKQVNEIQILMKKELKLIK